MFLGREIMRPGLLGKLGFLDKARDAQAQRRGVQAPRRARSRTRARGWRTCPAVSARASRSAARSTWAKQVVFMDEPTAALGVVQTRNVLEQIKRVREHGPVGRADQPQHARGLRGRRPHRGAAARRARRAAEAAATSRWRTSSAAMTGALTFHERGGDVMTAPTAPARRGRPRRGAAPRPRSRCGSGCSAARASSIALVLVGLIVVFSLLQFERVLRRSRTRATSPPTRRCCWSSPPA